MSVFTVTRVVPLSVEETWARLTDFAGHGEAVPLTRMRLDPGSPRVGWEFAGITGIGPVAFADPMVLTAYDPPGDGRTDGRFRIVKIGRWLRGWAEVSVAGTSDASTRVTWTEELGPRLDPLPAVTGPLSAWAGRRLFAHTLDALLASPGEPRRPQPAPGRAAGIRMPRRAPASTLTIGFTRLHWYSGGTGRGHSGPPSRPGEAVRARARARRRPPWRPS